MIKRPNGKLVKTYAKTFKEASEESEIGIYDPYPISVLDMHSRRIQPTPQDLDIWKKVFQDANLGFLRKYLICG